MRIKCVVEEIEMYDDLGTVPSVSVICFRCAHETKALVTSGQAIATACSSCNFCTATGDDEDWT